MSPVSPSATFSPQALHERATRALQAGAYAEAARLLEQAPDDANFNALRGIHAQLTGDNEAAVVFFDKVLANRKNTPEVVLNKVRSLTQLKRFDDAVKILEDFIAVMPGAAAFVLLSEIYEQMKDKPKAVEAMGRALAKGAKAPEITGNYWLGKRDLCDWSEPLPDFAISDITPAVATVISADPAFQRQVAEYFCRTRFPQSAPRPVPKPVTGRRIRIGYLSADIHFHATAFLIAELFALHDKTFFETFCFSYGGDDESAIRQRIKDTAEHFIDLKNMPLPDVVNAIRGYDVDVLVDLKGHTRNHALAVLAQRPAPIQIHYLGHPGTIGASFIDYLVGDDIVTPPGCEAHYTEKLIRMPGSYQINDRVRPIADTKPRSAYGLPDDKTVLAVFNQTYKITPEMFAIWMDIMKARPDTVLWLFQSVKHAEDNLRREAEKAGVDPARLFFAPLAANDEHLARYRTVDIVMDTCPYGGHTTTSDALWAGTPVVTLAGQTYPSRVAASLLTNVGLPELVTTTPAAYENKIMELIDNPGERTRLRMHLGNVRGSCALFDTPRWVKAWEEALLKIISGHKT
ncbi:MAG: hypothetical protein AB7G06_02565 [Bdellovibrionales bacterium]